MFTSALVLVAYLLPLAVAAQQVPPQDPLLSLAVRYADGRISQHVVRQDPGSAYTTLFPRVAGWQPAAGEPDLEAVQFSWLRKPDGVEVRVSVRRGRPHQETTVATVLVKPNTTVAVDALRVFGAEAVQLSLQPAPQVPGGIPNLMSAAASISPLGVEIASDGSPRYFVTIENTSAAPLRSFSIEVYRGGRLALGGGRRGPEGRPIVDARATYTFDVPMSVRTAPNFAATAESADEIRITAALWTDGAAEGNLTRALDTVAFDYGMFLQLSRVVEAQRRAAADAAADSRAAIEQLRVTMTSLSTEPSADDVTVARLRMRFPERVDDATARRAVSGGLAFVKTDAVTEVAALAEKASITKPGDLARVISQAVDRYEAWRARISR